MSSKNNDPIITEQSPIKPKRGCGLKKTKKISQQQPIAEQPQQNEPPIIEQKILINPEKHKKGNKANKNGDVFEKFTENEERLIKNGGEKIILGNAKTHYCIKKILTNGRTLILAKKEGFVKYVEKEYGVISYKEPDEAYIIEENGKLSVLKILEKKAQITEGSVIEKLVASIGFKILYNKMFAKKFDKGILIRWAFCVNNFLRNKITKNTSLADKMRLIDFNEMNAENDITYLFGDDEDYFKKLDEWIYA